jgi:hypothetical protein
MTEAIASPLDLAPSLDLRAQHRDHCVSIRGLQREAGPADLFRKTVSNALESRALSSGFSSYRR